MKVRAGKINTVEADQFEINIGPREQFKRRLLGKVALIASVALTFVLIAYGAPRLVRLVIFFPLWMAALGYFQAREKTCIALAARGTCDMDAGEQKIEDPARKAKLREKARKIHLRALIMAIVLTLLILAFP
ncbi:MAG TPA: hypothetical protein VLR90_13490 [Blastocatellia bacterium]|nr:hypothetical protein [Blastocatellia bacterium]